MKTDFDERNPEPLNTWLCACGMVNFYPDRTCYICSGGTKAGKPNHAPEGFKNTAKRGSAKLCLDKG